MSNLTTVIVEINGTKKRIKIDKHNTNLNVLKQKIRAKFNTFNQQFNIMWICYEELCMIDDDDIEDFKDGTKLSIEFLSKSDDIQIENTNNSNDEKQYIEESKYDDDLDDGEQEVQVNKHDLREKASGSTIKDENIISCIGKIRSTFIGSDGLTKASVGTGTVYKVDGLFAYIITCAHNLRMTEYFECNKCNQRNKTRKCSNCNTFNCTAKILKAGKIYFQQRHLETGDINKQYKCDVFYIKDDKYAEFPLAKSGYDIAILKFKDKHHYYKSVTENILLVDGKLLHSVRKQHDSYYIFGYPDIVIKNANTDKYKHREEMWGAESIDDKFEYDYNHYNNSQLFVKQQEIDASFGTSGAAMFSIYGKFALIFAIHTGGSSKFKYNVGNFLDNKIDYLQIETVTSETIKTVNDLIKDTLKKIELKCLKNKFIYKRLQPEQFNYNSNNNHIYNIGIVCVYFRPTTFNKNLSKRRGTGCIVKYSSQYAFILTAANVLKNIDSRTADKISFQLVQNTDDGLGIGQHILKFAAISWKLHPHNDNIAVIKISDVEGKLQNIARLRFRSLDAGYEYKKAVVIGYNSPYGLQLFGMKGDIECYENKKEIKYKNIVWSGGGPIFSCDEIKNDNNNIANDISNEKHDKLLLIKKLLSKGLHIDSILNGLAQTNNLNDEDIYNYVCGDKIYKPSTKDKETYDKKDSNYHYIFNQFDKEIIGIDTGKYGVLLTNELLKWIQKTCSSL